MRSTSIISLRNLLIASIIVLFSFPAICAESVSRGEMVKYILDTLNIPPWTGERTFSDVPESHLHSSYIETARALGLIYPSERFHPDLKATRAEALMFALKAMGWEHESGLASWVYQESENDLPAYIAPYHSLAKRIDPPAPSDFLSGPDEDLEDNDLSELQDWISSCLVSMTWHEEIGSGVLKLIIHRQGVGTPPGAWAVKIFSSSERTEAERFASKFASLGMKVFIVDNICSFTVNIGPFTHYGEAWNQLSSLSSDFRGLIVPVGKSSTRALFWASIVTNEREVIPSIVTAPSLGTSTLPLSALTAGTNGVAGVNGGYFYKDKPVGSLISGGEFLGTPIINRSAVGWDKRGNIHFGNGTFRSTLHWGKDGKIVLTDYNNPPRMNGAALFTPSMGRFAKGIPPNSTEILLSSGRVAHIRSSSGSNHLMDTEDQLIVLRGFPEKQVSTLRKGMPVSIRTEFFDSQLENVELLVQGGPLLLNDRNPLQNNEGLSSRITDLRHPRTLVGFDGARTWFIVVDGRNSWHSSGITLMEAQILLDHLGMTYGLNLDGGGSSQIQWLDHVVNLLPGGQERSLPYGLIFFEE
ncbi:MAG: phosphodiester glycosidase family protein [Synergistales bacterium]|nr:phosphodiester glycosidase family protein [Synergistales bacterium]